MRVLYATTWDEKCGMATYAAQFVASLKEYDVDITIADVRRPISDFVGIPADITFFNYVPTLPYNGDWVNSIDRLSGRKILGLQSTMASGNRSTFTDRFVRVVVHHGDVTQQAPNFVFIPHGIIEVPGDSVAREEIIIGTAGFPFPHKRLRDIAAATRHIDSCKVVFRMPESRHVDATKEAEACRAIIDGRHEFTVISDWVDEIAVVYGLRECSVAVFGNNGGGGVSGAARLGISAKIPVVVQDDWHFKDIVDYLYSVPDFGDHKALAETIVKAHQEREDCWSKPLADMGWSVVAAKFYSLFEEVLAVA